MPAHEEVMVVPRTELEKAGDFRGFTPDFAKYRDALLIRQAPRFLPRNEVEDDPRLKQIIPYIVLTSYIGPDLRYFVYRRGVKQGESRLHKKLSLGIGGHINPIDQVRPEATALSCVKKAASRELDEELVVECGEPWCVGAVNHDDDAVGKVHLGLVYRARMRVPNCYPRENNMDSWGWVGAAELLEQAEQYEPWSRFIIQEGLHLI